VGTKLFLYGAGELGESVYGEKAEERPLVGEGMMPTAAMVQLRGVFRGEFMDGPSRLVALVQLHVSHVRRMLAFVRYDRGCFATVPRGAIVVYPEALAHGLRLRCV